MKTVSAVRADVVMPSACPHAAAVADVDGWTLEIIVAPSVVVAYGEMPCVSQPAHRTVEIVERRIESILPVEEDAAQICIAVAPIVSVAV